MTGTMAAVTDPEMLSWLRQQIRARLYLANHAIELGNAPEWTELSSGVLMTIAADAPQDNWGGVHPLGDSSLTRLMEANDPQDTITRCEAELAILDLHKMVIADAGDSYDQARGQRERIVNEDPDEKAIERLQWSTAYLACRECRRRFPCKSVRLLAAGYRHRDGWKEEWAS